MRLESTLHKVHDFVASVATDSEGCRAWIVVNWVNIHVPVHAMVAPSALLVPVAATLLITAILGRAASLFIGHARVVERFKAGVEGVVVGRRFLYLLCLGEQFWPQGHPKAKRLATSLRLQELTLRFVDVITIWLSVVEPVIEAWPTRETIELLCV